MQDAIGIDDRAEKPDGLSIQDPHNPKNNISGGSSRAKLVFQTFAAAHNALQTKMELESAKSPQDWSSLLVAIIGGCYDSYRDYRHAMHQRGWD